jgi:hypothetical protein
MIYVCFSIPGNGTGGQSIYGELFAGKFEPRQKHMINIDF